MQTETLVYIAVPLAVLLILVIAAHRNLPLPRDASLAMQNGRVVPIRRTPFLLGRGPGNAIPIPNNLVSRRHASIVFERGQFILRDGRRRGKEVIESTNGTYLNGQRIRQAALQPGDQIMIGAVPLIFQRGVPRRTPVPVQKTPDSGEITALPVNGADSHDGQVVRDFAITEKIGEGGMAVVYKAISRRDGHTLAAIKILTANDAYIRDKFWQEAEIGASLRHPHIAHVYDFGQLGDRYYITMEYVDGGTLRERLLIRQPLSTEQIVVITGQVCEGLAYAWSTAGVVHRDIKPENLMWSPQSGMKIIDFGIARLATRVTVTTDGKLIGTPLYMSADQARGLQDLDGRSDIYSLGVVLYELLTGRPPFEGNALDVVAMHMSREMPPRPRELNPAIPERLDQVVWRALAKERSERYQNAMQMASDLGYKAGMTTRLPPLPARTATPARLVVSPGAVPGLRRTGQLLVVRGRSTGLRLPVSRGELILQRHLVDGLDTLISRDRHAHVFLQGGRFWIEDLGSRNGTFVNGRRIEQATVIERGDEIRIGTTVLHFEG